jgi:hypothetical protein
VHGVDRPAPSAGLLPWYIAKDLQHPLHIAWVWDNVSGKGAAYPHYVGGVLSLSQEQMRRCNGFPNNYWGWGGEDDELRRRFEDASPPLGLLRPAKGTGTLEDLEADMLSQDPAGSRASDKRSVHKLFHKVLVTLRSPNGSS